MNSRHARTLAAIFARPTRSDVHFNDVVALMRALGAEIDTRREGSRVTFMLNGRKTSGVHKPHPRLEMKKYQVELVREFLDLLGIRPPDE
jgi:hypothetical protein